MNFLAHAFLAGPADSDLIGGLIGDFVKGPLPAGLPAPIASGVALHRRIDSFAETHPAFRASRARVSPARRRVGGIMVDLFYDHFLAHQWPRYSPQPLEHFTAAAYAALAGRAEILPERLAQMLPRMQAEDWFASYRDIEVLGQVLDRMSAHRFSRANPLAGGVEELRADYAGFAADFAAFLPDALAFCAAWRAAREPA